MDGGRRTVEGRRWTVDGGRWTTESGHSIGSIGSGLRRFGFAVAVAVGAREVAAEWPQSEPRGRDQSVESR